METKLTSRTDNEAQLTVSLDAKHLEPIKAKVYDRLRKNVKVAGFRPGKAPDAIVERELGTSVVQSEIIETAVQDSYSQAVREENLPIVAPPQISLEKFVPYTELEYKVTVELMPKVQLPEYQKFRLKRPEVKVETEEIERTIDDLRRREAAKLDVDRPAKLGDEINFDFDGSKDGQPVRGAKAEKQTLQLGSNSFIPGFEEQLVGLSAGEEKTFNITFPEQYHEPSLAGEEVTFKVKVHKVTELVMPEADSAFVERVSPFKDLEQLREDITAKILSQKAEEASRQYEQEVLDRLLKESEFKAPDALVQQQLQRMRGELNQNLAYSGLDFDKYLELSGKTSAEMEQEMRPEAERRVGLAMILTEVATAEKLSVSREELDAEIKRLKDQYPDKQTQAELDNPSTREEVYNHLMASRVIAKLLSYAEQGA